MKDSYRRLPMTVRLAAGSIRAKTKIVKSPTRPPFAMDQTTYPDVETSKAAFEKALAEDRAALNLV